MFGWFRKKKTRIDSILDEAIGRMIGREYDLNLDNNELVSVKHVCYHIKLTDNTGVGFYVKLLPYDSYVVVMVPKYRIEGKKNEASAMAIKDFLSNCRGLSNTKAQAFTFGTSPQTGKYRVSTEMGTIFEHLSYKVVGVLQINRNGVAALNLDLDRRSITAVYNLDRTIYSQTLKKAQRKKLIKKYKQEKLIS